MIIPSADDQIVVGVYAKLASYRQHDSRARREGSDLLTCPARALYVLAVWIEGDAEVRFIRCALDGNGVQIDLLLRVRPEDSSSSSMFIS